MIESKHCRAEWLSKTDMGLYIPWSINYVPLASYYSNSLGIQQLSFDGYTKNVAFQRTVTSFSFSALLERKGCRPSQYLVLLHLLLLRALTWLSVTTNRDLCNSKSIEQFCQYFFRETGFSLKGKLNLKRPHSQKIYAKTFWFLDNLNPMFSLQ